MNNDIYSFYTKGREEGYFNVRLESSILKKNQETRQVFLSGYKLGRQIRKNEELSETEDSKQLYIQRRSAYITSMGYKAACDGYSVDSSSLNDEDKNAFELGYNAGVLCNIIRRDSHRELENYKRQIRMIKNE